jgi:hypothetical protein
MSIFDVCSLHICLPRRHIWSTPCWVYLYKLLAQLGFLDPCIKLTDWHCRNHEAQHHCWPIDLFISIILFVWRIDGTVTSGTENFDTTWAPTYAPLLTTAVISSQSQENKKALKNLALVLKVLPCPCNYRDIDKFICLYFCCFSPYNENSKIT